MPKNKLFSTKKKLQERSGSDLAGIYLYDSVPQQLRAQILYILRDAIGVCNSHSEGYFENRDTWNEINAFLARELGTFDFDNLANQPDDKFKILFIQAGESEALDFIDAAFRVIESPTSFRARDIHADKAIEELNDRFLEHAVGYQFESGRLIQIDSKFVHAEIVKPALTLLSKHKFKGPEEEFLKAHEHYRHARYKNAMDDALKAFESVMKAICDEQSWAYDREKANAGTLINIIFEKKLIPSELQTHFASLRALLEAGLPTARNRKSAHGQGKDQVEVPKSLAAFALHLAASNILLLIESHESTRA